MKIAIPLTYGQLSAHFGHCEQFVISEVDRAAGKVLRQEYLVPPPHAPGVLPRWLHEKDVHVIIVGGMGQRARQLFADKGIEVIVGASGNLEAIMNAYLAGNLKTGENICDH